MPNKDMEEAKRRPPGTFRFVVTGNNVHGRSYVVRDEFVSTTDPGTLKPHLYKTTPEQLADYLGAGNEGDLQDILPPFPILPNGWGPHEMPEHGAVLVGFNELPPREAQPWEDIEYGTDVDRSAGEGWRYGFHRHRTIDYNVVTQGEYWLYLEEGEVFLRAGDVVVQRNTNHAWQRHGYEGPCSFVGTLIMVHGGKPAA